MWDLFQLVQYLKINQYNPLHQQAMKKNMITLIDAEVFDKYLFMITTLQTRNRGELPQLTKNIDKNQ